MAADEVLPLLRGVNVETRGERAEAHLHLDLNFAWDKVVGRGSIAGFFDVSCVRCLAPASVVLDEPEVTVTFVSVAEAEAADWDLEDASSYAYDGDEIDLEPLVRETLVLAVPIAPLCGDGCRGLCRSCGADLNQEPCSCDQSLTASPWKAALARTKVEGDVG